MRVIRCVSLSSSPRCNRQPWLTLLLLLPVRSKYDPNLDVRTHPQLGGMFAGESIAEDERPTEEPPVEDGPRQSLNEPRISMTSMRPLRRTETSGSHIGARAAASSCALIGTPALTSSPSCLPQ